VGDVSFESSDLTPDTSQSLLGASRFLLQFLHESSAQFHSPLDVLQLLDSAAVPAISIANLALKGCDFLLEPVSHCQRLGCKKQARRKQIVDRQGHGQPRRTDSHTAC